MAAPAQSLGTAQPVTLPPGSWRERWLGLRNALLSSPRFQRWAARFPPTRPLARRNARALFDLVGGFVYSQVLSACVELDLFEALAAGPLPISALAPRLALSEDAADRLLKAAAALDLTERVGNGRYALGSLGAALRGNPSVAAMIAHHRMLYDDLAAPVALLRGEAAEHRLADFWAYARSADPAALPAEKARAYSALMLESQALIAAAVLDSYPIGQHRRLLDIGGGAGGFLAEAARRAPALELMLFDLPAVVPHALARLSCLPDGRVAVFSGNFFTDPLPRGADIVSLVRVLHDHDDEAALAILRAAHAALPANGTLLIAEPMSGTPGSAPIGDAYFGFYLLAMGSGRPRTPDELSGLLLRSGFSDVRLRPTAIPLVVRTMTARA